MPALYAAKSLSSVPVQATVGERLFELDADATALAAFRDIDAAGLDESRAQIATAFSSQFEPLFGTGECPRTAIAALLAEKLAIAYEVFEQADDGSVSVASSAPPLARGPARPPTLLAHGASASPGIRAWSWTARVEIAMHDTMEVGLAAAWPEPPIVNAPPFVAACAALQFGAPDQIATLAAGIAATRPQSIPAPPPPPPVPAKLTIDGCDITVTLDLDCLVVSSTIVVLTRVVNGAIEGLRSDFIARASVGIPATAPLLERTLSLPEAKTLGDSMVAFFRQLLTPDGTPAANACRATIACTWVTELGTIPVLLADRVPFALPFDDEESVRDIAAAVESWRERTAPADGAVAFDVTVYLGDRPLLRVRTK